MDFESGTESNVTSISGTFTMTGGTIIENTVNLMGGGVFNASTFKMTDGKIIGNKAIDDTSGGGVGNYGIFTITGGTISDNIANSGGGVGNGGILKLSGGKPIIISDNTDEEATKNNVVYANYTGQTDSDIASPFPVQVISSLSTGSRIGLRPTIRTNGSVAVQKGGGFTGDITSSDFSLDKPDHGTLTIREDGNLIVTAATPETYTLTVTPPTEGGTIEVKQDEKVLSVPYTVNSGTVLTLTAKPVTGYKFSAWTVTDTTTNSPLKITIDSNKTIGASFMKDTSTDPKPSVASPVINPDRANFDSSQTVTVTCSTEGSTIFYTLDNSEPTASSTKYTTPFQISATTTVRGIAVKADYVNSPAVTAIFTKTSVETPKYTLTVTQPSNGSIAVTGNGITDPTLSSYTVHSVTVV